MDALKLLVDMVKDLPALAIWVILAYFVFKLTIVGSIYGVIKLAIIKAHDVAVNPKRKEVEVDARLLIDGVVISGTKEELLRQLLRLRNKRPSTFQSKYIHSGDVAWLSEAISEKEQREDGVTE